MEPRDYLSVALQRLDLLLHREILRLRASYQLSLDEFRGLYISDEQVNQLVNRAVNYAGPSSAIDELTENAELLRADSNGDDGSPWHRLVVEFSLSPIEQDILLLAVAPELDLKYETLFAYLNNDITRKWPTFGLALRTSARRHGAKNRGAPLSVAGSEALQQRTAATDQFGQRSALLAGYGFCGGAAGLPVSRRRPIARSAPGVVCRAAKHVDRLAAAVHRRRSRNALLSLCASHGRLRNPAGRW